MTKKSIFSKINESISTAKKIQKELSSDDEDNFTSKKFAKKKPPAEEKQSTVKQGTATIPPPREAVDETPITSSDFLKSPAEMISAEWVDESTYVQRWNSFEITSKLNKQSHTVNVVLLSEVGCFADIFAFKSFFVKFIEEFLGSMPVGYTVASISANAVFDSFSNEWDATWTPDAEIQYAKR
ncbi:MAG: hypothetical protein LBV40_04750 [Methanomicrobiales archaeon]|nr:hypothetical protein [Methanomicrobiales archaeon]